MPWPACPVMDERLRLVVNMIDGEPMTEVCRGFGISRKTGYEVLARDREHRAEALSDALARPCAMDFPWFREQAGRGLGREAAARNGGALIGFRALVALKELPWELELLP